MALFFLTVALNYKKLLCVSVSNSNFKFKFYFFLSSDQHNVPIFFPLLKVIAMALWIFFFFFLLPRQMTAQIIIIYIVVSVHHYRSMASPRKGSIKYFKLNTKYFEIIHLFQPFKISSLLKERATTSNWIFYFANDAAIL